MAETQQTAESSVERERRMLAEANTAGGAQKYGTFLRLSGPGWIQSAITLGGGSLASSLYLGVLGGYSLMWVQPLAMVFGIIMLSAIGYVTLSTGKRPFPAINNHISPVLGWSWALAVAAANIIWVMPQQSLAYDVLSKNLLPNGWFGADGGIVAAASSAIGDGAPWLAANADKFLVATILLTIATAVTWSYDRGGVGLRLYELVLKIVVALIVLCFAGVVVKLSFSDVPLQWGKILASFVPNFGQFFRPSAGYMPLLEAINDPAAREFWRTYIVAEQRDVIIAAAATAVGINMTFIYPYSMLRKGWSKEFRALARFDLSTGMFIPFLIATSCVVLASAARFHTELPAGFEQVTGESGEVRIDVPPDHRKFASYQKLLTARDAHMAHMAHMTVAGVDQPDSQASVHEERLAAMLVRRDALDLASALEPLTGATVANVVFGLGVLAMALSTISALMLISGVVFTEILALPPSGWPHRMGTLVAGVSSVMWPLLWAGESGFYLAVVTSVFGFMLLPFAYITFAALLNSRNLLGAELPRGGRRIVANLLVLSAAAIATVAAVYMVWIKAGKIGIAVLAGFALLTLLVGLNRVNTRRHADRPDQ